MNFEVAVLTPDGGSGHQHRFWIQDLQTQVLLWKGECTGRKLQSPNSMLGVYPI
jgi:hypothetical protein